MRLADTAPTEPPHLYLTTQEVADRYKTSVRTIEGWRFRGVGPRARRLGGHIRYHIDDLRRFEEATGV